MTGRVLPVWWDEAADGPTNMATDELLAEEAIRHDGLVMRLYAWASPAVSLGAFQRVAEAEAAPGIAGLPLVRRPSGGGAIVHGSDLTYAAAVPRSHAWARSPEVFYDSVHRALVAALADAGVSATLHVAAADDPPPDELFCFSRRAPGDVVAATAEPRAAGLPPKIMGSAQRRLGTTVLQHGSLLLAANPATSGPAHHPGLAEIAGPGRVSPRGLAETWIRLIAAAVGVESQRQATPFAVGREAAIADRRARFCDPRWTGRR